MTYRILTDGNVERATVNYLRKLGHDVERLDDVTELGLGSEDEAIARYAREHDRLILTQDDDFFTELAVGTPWASSFSKTRRCPRARLETRFTRCRSISNGPTSSPNT